MSAWFVSVLVLIVVEAVCVAILIGLIVMAVRRYRRSRVSEPRPN